MLKRGLQKITCIDLSNGFSVATQIRKSQQLYYSSGTSDYYIQDKGKTREGETKRATKCTRIPHHISQVPNDPMSRVWTVAPKKKFQV